MSTRPRSLILAAVLGFFAPGLGHLYVGRAWRFLLAAFAFFAVVFALGLAGALSTFVGAVTYLFLLAALVIYAVVDPPLIARRQLDFESKWYTRWYVYLGWVAVIVTVFTTLLAMRESVLGYSIFRLPGIAMSPAIEPREVILVDTRAFHSHPPTAGDVVVVRGPKSGVLYVRRVSDQSGLSRFSFASDNPKSSPFDIEFTNVADPEILGQVTYVLYSPTIARIGQRIK